MRKAKRFKVGQLLVRDAGGGDVSRVIHVDLPWLVIEEIAFSRTYTFSFDTTKKEFYEVDEAYAEALHGANWRDRFSKEDVMRDDRGAMAANDLRVGMIVRVVRGCIKWNGKEDFSWQLGQSNYVRAMKIVKVDLPVINVKHLDGERSGDTFALDADHGWGLRLLTPAECPIAANECPLLASKCPLACKGFTCPLAQ